MPHVPNPLIFQVWSGRRVGAPWRERSNRFTQWRREHGKNSFGFFQGDPAHNDHGISPETGWDGMVNNFSAFLQVLS
jgi:hypothetical protein